jgi:type IV secretory pathway VirB10-like protein
MKMRKMMKEIFSQIKPEVTRIKSWILPAAVLFVIVITIGVVVGLSDSNKSNDENSHPSSQRVALKTANDNDLQKIQEEGKVAQQNNPQKPQTQTNGNNIPVPNNAAPTNAQNNSIQDDTQTLQKVMTAPISSNQLTGSQNENSNTGNNTLSNNSSSSTGTSNPVTQEDPNLQAEKKDFLKINSQPNPDDYLSASVQKPISPYEIQAGTVIPGVLITGINSDLPGQITGQVRENVYDSITGNYLLIPQGAKVVGLYDSQVAYGQERVLIAWKRIIFPNGNSIDLQGMPGIDLSGYSGFNDQVNNHYTKIFGSVILMSLLSAGAQLSQPQNQSSNLLSVNNPTIGQSLAQSLGTNIANTGTMMTQKNLNIQPTLMIRPGYEFNINVTKDMLFPGTYQES